MNEYVILINVLLKKPIPILDSKGNMAVGYYQKFWIHSLTLENAKKTVSEQITDGKIEWSGSTIAHTPNVDTTETSTKIIGKIGRMYYPEKELE